MLLLENDATLFQTLHRVLQERKESVNVNVNVKKKKTKIEDDNNNEEEEEEDCCSLASSIVSEQALPEERRVSFDESLITEIHTRPYTPKEEVKNLFYTCADTAR